MAVKKAAIQLENDISVLAMYCSIQHLKRELSLLCRCDTENQTNELLYYAAKAVYHNEANKELLQNTLSKLGLHLDDIVQSHEVWPSGVRSITHYELKFSLV